LPFWGITAEYGPILLAPGRGVLDCRDHRAGAAEGLAHSIDDLLVGVAGIFGYHFFYFRAFALAPAVEANLITFPGRC
jgi:hypothetical protein